MTLFICGILGSVGGLLISASTLLILGYLLKYRMLNALTARFKQDWSNNPHQSDGVLNETLDHLIHSLKSQIPMGGLLLGGTLQDKIKLKLKGEITSLLPNLLPRLISQSQGELNREMNRQFRIFCIPIFAAGFFFGGALGIVFFLLQ